MAVTPNVAALLVAEIEWDTEQEQRRQQQEEEARMLAGMASMQAVQTEHTWRLYGRDPLAWVRDMIDWREGEGPTGYQGEILSAVPLEKRVAVYGPHVIGKSAMMSWLILWFALTRDGRDWKSPTTASAWRQLTKYLWPEVRKWARRLRWDKLGRAPFKQHIELLQLSLKLDTGEAFAAASDVPENMEGAHADHLMGIFDEAKVIPDATFDAFEGAFSGTGETLVAAMSTPGPPVGRFYDICSRKPGTEDWYVRHVTMEEAISAGRMSAEWAEQRKRLWGQDSAVYKNRVLGVFAADDEDTLIPLTWIEEAIERWRAIMEPVADEHGDVPAIELPPWTGVGVDVGQGSVKSDKTTFALRYGDVVSEIRKYRYANTMETAGRVKGLLDKLGGYAVIDATGIGVGTLDRLKEQDARAYGFVAGSTDNKKRDRSGELGFADRRSEAWWTVRELLDPSGGATIALPPDDEMIGDLTAPKWTVKSGAKIKVESKDELRKEDRLGRSTDVGDAVIQIFWDAPVENESVNLPIGIPNIGGWMTE